MKKKLTAIFLCVALAAIAIVGASLAYFTDTDSATNTFTVGNVKIQLLESSLHRENAGIANGETSASELWSDVANGEGIRCALGIGEVRKRCAHDGDRRESDTQEDRGQFLFHVCLLLLCSIIFFLCPRTVGGT